MPIALAIGLTHERFGAIVLAFDKAIADARGQEREKGENFLPPPPGCATRDTVG